MSSHERNNPKLLISSLEGIPNEKEQANNIAAAHARTVQRDEIRKPVVQFSEEFPQNPDNQ